LADKLNAAINDAGWGLWALERQDNGAFIGFTGLNPFSDLPVDDGVEIGWRLDPDAWGFGFATEAARAALAFGFETLALNAIDSFTATINQRSIAVMQRLGMQNTGSNFFHPRVPEESPLREHVLYRITYDQWSASKK